MEKQKVILPNGVVVYCYETIYNDETIGLVRKYEVMDIEGVNIFYRLIEQNGIKTEGQWSY